jgi:tetratricopeptide (TPR) repeat protein
MNIPKALQDSLRAGNVIPFVGAGVSMSVLDNESGERLFPSWRELLEQAAKRLEEEERIPYANAVRALLEFDRPDYLEAARRAREGLGDAVWYRFLKEQLDFPSEAANSESLGLAQSVWNLNSKLIVTTNYDNVLRWASPSDPVLWDREAPAEMAGFLRGEMKRHTIWHLHGQIDNVSNLILTRDGYGLLYPEAKRDESRVAYEAALKTLHSLMASHTFLFIGFSLDDLYFGMQLEGIKNIYQGATGPHYVLMNKKESGRGFSLGDAVRAIEFEDFGEPLLNLVKDLGAIANSVQATTIEGKTPVPPPVPRVADYDPHYSVFSVPFRQKGDQVIGREAAIQAVRKQLAEGQRTAIGQAAAFQGLGGLGKTQLAVEYAYRFKDTYPNGVIWLNADQDIDAQLTELAEKARWIAPESEHKYKLDIALHRLRTYSDCLIIFDNLENPQTIADYLPEPQASPHILVTSRIDQPDFNPVPLDPLNEALSYELLLQEAGRKPGADEEEKAAHEIAVTLDGLPLALELAGAYLRHRPLVDWKQYNELLRHSLKAALPGKLSSFTKHETDLYSTLRINEEIFEEEPRLKEILDLLTWSGTAPMGLDLLCALLNVDYPLELTNALGLGTTLRLLQKTPDVDSYSIHRLVAQVRRQEIPLQERQGWVDSICKLIGDWFNDRRQGFSNLFRFEAEIDHLRAWQQNAELFAPRYLSRLIWLQAYPSYHRGQYLEIKSLVEKALRLFQQRNENDFELKANLLNDLGFSYGELADYKRALEYDEEALEIRKSLFGEEHPETAMSFNNVGAAYGRLGNHERSLEYGKRALEIFRRLFGEEHSETAMSFDNIGNTYGDLRDHKRHLEYSTKALEIRKKRFGEEHPDTAISFNNVGMAYADLGDYKRSLEYCNKALEIRQKLFGDEHPDTALALNNLGSIFARLGDDKRSLECYEEALKVRMEILGDKHPDTVKSVCDIVTALTELNRRPEAFSLLEATLTGLPSDHSGNVRLKRLEHKLLSKPIRPGFRQPTSKRKKQKSKKKRR